MKHCLAPACPFRVRHGFAAEFADHVEHCKSCATALSVVSDSEPQAEGEAHLHVATRLAFSVGAMVAFGVLASLNFEVGSTTQSLGSGVLALSIAAVIVASGVVEGVCALAIRADALPERLRGLRTTTQGRARMRALSAVLAMLGLSLVGLFSARPLGLWQLLLLAGPALWLGVAALIDRWGLGHGASLATAAVLGQQLVAAMIAAGTEWPTLAVEMIAMAGLVGVMLARPARSASLGRVWTPDRGSGAAEPPQIVDGDFGLGLTLPVTSLLPLHAWIWLAPLFALARPDAAFLDLRSLMPVIAIAALGAILAWAFARPSLLLTHWGRAFPAANPAVLEREARSLFGRALLRSELVLVALVLLPEVPSLPSLPSLHGWMALVCSVVALDLGREVSARLDAGTDLVAVAIPGKSLIEAEALALAISLGNPTGARVIVQGGHHRSLWRAAGWWLPLRLLVTPEEAARVRERISSEPTSR